MSNPDFSTPDKPSIDDRVAEWQMSEDQRPVLHEIPAGTKGMPDGVRSYAVLDPISRRVMEIRLPIQMSDRVGAEEIARDVADQVFYAADLLTMRPIDVVDFCYRPDSAKPDDTFASVEFRRARGTKLRVLSINEGFVHPETDPATRQSVGEYFDAGFLARGHDEVSAVVAYALAGAALQDYSIRRYKPVGIGAAIAGAGTAAVVGEIATPLVGVGSFVAGVLILQRALADVVLQSPADVLDRRLAQAMTGQRGRISEDFQVNFRISSAAQAMGNIRPGDRPEDVVRKLITVFLYIPGNEQLKNGLSPILR